MAWRSLVQSRGLTAVMVAALSLGIATWYVQHQVFVFLDGKTPDAPADLYQVTLERGDRPPAERMSIVTPLVPSIMLSLHDAHSLVAGARSAITFSAPALVEPAGSAPQTVRARYATRQLFALFAVPFAEGRPWENDAADEVVLDERFARRLFGNAPAVGWRLRIDGAELRVVGVVAAEHAERYHLYERFVLGVDELYLPLAHAARARPDFQHPVAGDEPGFASVWVELPTAAGRADFTAAGNAYLARERVRGRASTPRAVALRSAAEWRTAYEPGGTIALWPVLAAMCMATSVLNLVRMLMAKFAGRGHDLGLLRALGGRRAAVMGQLLLEALLIGLAGAAGGIAIGIGMMPIAASTLVETPGSPSTLSAGALLATLGVSVGAALLAALYPAWRLSRGTPAALLRTSS